MLVSSLGNERVSLVHHRGCRCSEGRWAWDDGEREWWRRVKLWWNDALAREEVKWRHSSWVVGRVIKIEITFFIASVSAREGRWWGEVLVEDEADAMSSSWLHRKEVWHDAVAWWRRLEERWHRGGERKETTSVGLIWILLGRKWRKFTRTIQLLQLDGEDLKQRQVNFF
jgi:hypothetical protein